MLAEEDSASDPAVREGVGNNRISMYRYLCTCRCMHSIGLCTVEPVQYGYVSLGQKISVRCRDLIMKVSLLRMS